MARRPVIRPTLNSRVRYGFDRTMSQGPSTALWWLGGITVVFAVLGGILLLFTSVNTGAGRVVKDFFLSLVATVDGGGEIGLNGGFTGNWFYLTVSFIVGFGGLIIVSAFIGLLATIMTEQAERLRKGRSKVVESGHTLVLGWSPKVFDIVSELTEANRNQRRASIVVLAAQDPVMMDTALRERVADLGPTRLVCRTGDPTDPISLEIVNAGSARSVIVLSDGDQGDAGAVRTTLALMQIDPTLTAPRLVVEVHDPDNAAILNRATDGAISTVVSTEVVSRITAEVCRQPGLSAVYLDFLDFDGDEIYFTPSGRLAGATFAQAMLAFPVASVIGLRRPGGVIDLDPAADTVLNPEDVVIAIAEDDDRLDVGAVPDAWSLAQASVPASPPTIDRILIIGWNDLGPRIVRELDATVAADSTVTVLVDPAWIDPDAVVVPATDRLHVQLTIADRGGTGVEAAASAPGLDHIVLLCYRGDRSPSDSDAQTLLTLLQLRHLMGTWPEGVRPPSIATELLDSRDVQLARSEHTDDFVVSERLTSLMMTQLSENPELQAVFDDLFSPGGTQLRLRPVTDELAGMPTSYSDLIKQTAAATGLLIGWRTVRPGQEPGLRLNPPKSEVVTLERGDQLIVMRSPRRTTAVS